jgi:hypothetical protein
MTRVSSNPSAEESAANFNYSTNTGATQKFNATDSFGQIRPDYFASSHSGMGSGALALALAAPPSPSSRSGQAQRIGRKNSVTMKRFIADLSPNYTEYYTDRASPVCALS